MTTTTTPVADDKTTNPADLFSGPDDFKDFLLVPDVADLNLDLLDTELPDAVQAPPEPVRHNPAPVTPVHLTTPVVWVYNKPEVTPATPESDIANNNNKTESGPAPLHRVPNKSTAAQ